MGFGFGSEEFDWVESREGRKGKKLEVSYRMIGGVGCWEVKVVTVKSV